MPRTLATPAGLMADAAFRAGFARLAPLGLSFDAWLYQSQLGELVALARAFPETPIVMDHCGGPLGIGANAGRRAAAFAEWAAGVRELGRCPNVWMKLGGLGMRSAGFDFHARPAPPSSEELAAAWRPYIETCLEAFGAERCMFESNFPVDKGSYGYAAYWNACKRLAQGASAAERTALFSGSAARFYRLDLPEIG
jgi:predicted TIM-barrel fold metal-dependent hydrolase